ncbi:hypothetical protein NLI96_g13399 [Meripilus lineatus]|uniref:SMP domain-containing protein n=1 Tax=Meripilus lineatus TaxID=2056292 RepID=A0AAD5UN89_9APHY|nr:hypothetical protein NLI96_g13399 [Physisporinus lineatus]
MDLVVAAKISKPEGTALAPVAGAAVKRLKQGATDPALEEEAIATIAVKRLKLEGMDRGLVDVEEATIASKPEGMALALEDAATAVERKNLPRGVMVTPVAVATTAAKSPRSKPDAMALALEEEATVTIDEPQPS